MLCAENSFLAGSLPDITPSNEPPHFLHESVSKNQRARFHKHESKGSELLGVLAKDHSVPSAQVSLTNPDNEDNLPWNYLIQKHVDNGDLSQAFCLFNSMRENHGLSNKTAYLALLKACANSVSLDKGRDLHMSITREGWDMNCGLENSLIDMYIACSALNDARDVFENLPVRNVSLWTTLMLGYINHGLESTALHFFDEMCTDRVSPDAVAFVCGLKACGSISSLDLGCKLYGQITKAGFESNPIVGNALISMYVKCGRTSEAHRVFDKLQCPDVVAWNALINGYADYGYYEDALHLLELMRQTEIAPTWITLLGGLKACNGLASIRQTKKLHAQIIEDGFEQILAIGNALVDVYSKCGLIVELQNIFDDMPIQDVVSWSALIAGYADNGHGEDAISCLERMQVEGVSPEIPTYVSSLKACSSLTALDTAQEIHARITAKALEKSTGINNCVIDVYAKCGSLEDARDVFWSMTNQDVVSWNALIAGYVDHGLGEEALSLLDEMHSKGVPSSVVTYMCALKACSIIGGLAKGQMIYSEIAGEGFETNAYVTNTVVDMYLKNGAVLDAQEAFEELTARDSISWSALLTGCAENGHFRLVHEFFEQMKVEVRFPDVTTWDALIFGFAEQGDFQEASRSYLQMQDQCLLPSTTTFVSLLNLCSDVAALEIGKRIHALIHGVMHGGGNVPLANALVDMYCGCGSTNEAHQLFEVLSTKDVVTWNTLINGHSRHGESKQVFQLLRSMEEDGVEPEGVTLQSALMAPNHVGLLEEGKAYFEDIIAHYGKFCTSKHYHCMADLLGRAGHVDEAAALLGIMPFKPDSVTWGTLLDACNKWGYVDLGAKAFHHVAEWDKMRTPAFMLMSNMPFEAWLGE